MELKEELLDEKNEEILKRLDNTIGLSKNKSVIRNIIKYSQVIRKTHFSETEHYNIETENYNIIIRNQSAYNLYEELISVISEIYCKNGIITKDEVYYMSREELKASKNIREEIKEEIIVIDLSTSRRETTDIRKYFEYLYNEMPNKIFIILEDNMVEGEINALLNDYIIWSMKINVISTEEKNKHIKKFFKENKLICSEEIVRELADNPYYKIKNDLINILVNCKMNNDNNVAKVLKREEKIVEIEEIEDTGLQELENLIGLSEVKEQIKKVINYLKVSKNRKNMPMLHMCFNGNPGTGKTTVARIVGKIFSEEKILSNKNIFVEAQRGDLIGRYVGQTAPQTQEMIDQAIGGVLFIDEAYAISSYIQDEAGRDYGAECIATLIKGMEDHRENLCVILAGYTKEMEHMLSTNPGFESRIQFNIDFPDYSTEELYEIFKQLCRKEKYKISPNVKQILLQQFDTAKKDANFSNARYVRSFFEKLKIEQANRVILENDDINLFKKCDILSVIDKMSHNEKKNKNIIGFMAS